MTTNIVWGLMMSASKSHDGSPRGVAGEGVQDHHHAPSAPELMRCEFRPAGVPVSVVTAITSRVQSNNERGCGQGTT